MKILQRVNKIPGGLVLSTLCITMLINTFFPSALRIGYSTTGCFTTAGTMTMIGMILLITGSQVNVNNLGTVLFRGGFFLIVRFAIGVITGYLANRYFGLDGFLGISTLALVICFTSLNPGIYMGCMQSFGDDIDKAAFSIMNIWGTPVIPVLVMNLSLGNNFDWNIIVSTLAPFLAGVVLGNLDLDLRKMLAYATPVVLMFLGFAFGSSINLLTAFRAGPSGLLLVVLYTAIGVPVMVCLDKLVLRRPGYAGAATCTVGMTFIASPALVAQTLPQYAPYAEMATAQIAMAVIITAFLGPYITGLVANKTGCPAFEHQNS